MSSQENANSIGLLQTTSLVTGNLVGSGVFLLPASLALFGAISLFGWVLTGIGALLLAFVFAHLSSKIQANGGPHNFILKTFGEEAGYWVAWGYWVLSWISNAALIVAAVSYFSSLYSLSKLQVFGLESFILAAVTLINLLGVRTAGRFEFVITLCKLIPLVAIPLVGIFYIDFSHFTPLVAPGETVFTGLKGTIFLCVWAFVGIETATVPSGEVKNAAKNVPLATMLGTIVAMVVYLLGFSAMIGVMGTTALSQSSAPYADLASHLFGGNWMWLITVTAIVCCLGSFNGWTMVVSRIAQGAAKQKLFPQFFAIEDRRNTPYMSLIVSALCTFPLLIISLQDNLVEQFNAIIDISITLILFIYAACILSYLKSTKGYANKGYLLVGLGALAFVGFAIWGAGIKMGLLSLLLLALGLPLRLYMKRQNVVKSPLMPTQNLSTS